MSGKNFLKSLFMMMMVHYNKLNYNSFQTKDLALATCKTYTNNFIQFARFQN